MILLTLVSLACTPPQAVAENVVILIADGLRREDVFGGADPNLLGSDQADLSNRFCSGDANAKRAALMPFFWHTVARNGQIFGDQSVGSVSAVANKGCFSYAGYSETLCGYPDPAIKCNAPTPNQNVTVFEWLNRQPGLTGRVAAFGAWAVISSVFNKERCDFVDNAGYEPISGCKMTPALQELNRLKAGEARVWNDEVADSLAFHTTLEYVKANHPRLLFLSMGETDKWCHENRYDLYLNAAHRYDAYVAELWNTMQAIPQYKGKTTFILTCDHGRGAGKDWTTHGCKYPNSKYTWMGFIGPGTRALGDVPGRQVTNGQIASTTAALLGYDYAMVQPKAAPSIRSVLR